MNIVNKYSWFDYETTDVMTFRVYALGCGTAVFYLLQLTAQHFTAGYNLMAVFLVCFPVDVFLFAANLVGLTKLLSQWRHVPFALIGASFFFALIVPVVFAYVLWVQPV